MIEFVHPHFLWLLIVSILGLFLLQWYSLTQLSSVHRHYALLIRMGILFCLVLAMTGIQWVHRSHAMAVLFLVDDSASISESAAHTAKSWIKKSQQTRPHDSIGGIVRFAEQIYLQQPLRTKMAETEWLPLEDRRETRIYSALRFAKSLLPNDLVRKVILLSDGHNTEHSPESAETLVQQMAVDGIMVDTVLLENEPRPEVLIKSLNLPHHVRDQEAFEAVVTVESNVETGGTLQLYRNHFLSAERAVAFKKGKNVFSFPNQKADDQFTFFEAKLEAKEDTILENNKVQNIVISSGKLKVLLIDEHSDRLRPLAESLKNASIDAETRSVSGLPHTIAELQPFNLILLSDVSVLQLGNSRMELLQQWVRDFGGGFLMLGGENSFGAGGYYRTPMETLLPVRMEHEDRQETPDVALLIALDRSGSMSIQADKEHTKMSLANQGVIQSMNVLQSRDMFGVFAVDTTVQKILPLAPVVSRSSGEREIMGITSGGGGIYVYTALKEAYQSIQDAPTKIKHVLLFADAADAEEKVAGEMDGNKTGESALDLAVSMAQKGVTTSVVALGLETDTDTAFLKQLAERGNGRFYLTNDPLSLPQIFTTETMKVAQNSLVEEPFQAVPTASAPDGIDWATAPFLLGYNTVKPKPMADIRLATEFGEPLLVSWRYGLGYAAAFTSDAKSKWAAEWLSWDGFGKFWAQTVRSLARKEDRIQMHADFSEQEDKIKVQIDALVLFPSERFLDEPSLSVTAMNSKNETFSATAEQTAPGHYECDLPFSDKETFLSITAHARYSDSAPFYFSYTRSYPEEFSHIGSDSEFLQTLARLGNGTFNPTPDAVFDSKERTGMHYRDLTPWFLIASLLLILLDIGMRRWSRDGKQK